MLFWKKVQIYYIKKKEISPAYFLIKKIFSYNLFIITKKLIFFEKNVKNHLYFFWVYDLIKVGKLNKIRIFLE